MTGGAWISDMMSRYSFFKSGLRSKYFGEDWAPARHEKSLPGEGVRSAIKRHAAGFALQRDEMLEAAAVFDEKSFQQLHDTFAVGGFYAVKGRLAELLLRLDLAPGGLIPFTIFEADLVTPRNGEFFLLNFGARKNTVLPEQSQNVVEFAVDPASGTQIWEVNSWMKDGDVALSSAALDGADLWFEEVLDHKIFVSDALAETLQQAELADDWHLKQCRIVETG